MRTQLHAPEQGGTMRLLLWLMILGDRERELEVLLVFVSPAYILARHIRSLLIDLDAKVFNEMNEAVGDGDLAHWCGFLTMIAHGSILVN